MASDDYSAAIGGGLKLKGSKPSGVTKKKKKDKSKGKPDPDDNKTSALQRALADEDPGAKDGTARAASEARSVGNEDEDYEPGSSKTEAERKYEEMRRKRVRLLHPQVQQAMNQH